jgi:hypothetical protein
MARPTAPFHLRFRAPDVGGDRAATTTKVAARLSIAEATFVETQSPG